MRRIMCLTVVAGSVAICMAVLPVDGGTPESRLLSDKGLAGTTGSWGACCSGVQSLNCPTITPTTCTCVGGGCGGERVPTGGTYMSCYGTTRYKKCRASHMTTCAYTWSCMITGTVYLTPCVPATGCTGSGLTSCDTCARDTSVSPTTTTVWNATCG